MNEPWRRITERRAFPLQNYNHCNNNTAKWPALEIGVARHSRVCISYLRRSRHTTCQNSALPLEGRYNRSTAINAQDQCPWAARVFGFDPARVSERDKAVRDLVQ